MAISESEPSRVPSARANETEIVRRSGQTPGPGRDSHLAAAPTAGDMTRVPEAGRDRPRRRAGRHRPQRPGRLCDGGVDPLMPDLRLSADHRVDVRSGRSAARGPKMAEGLCRTRPDVASLRSRLNVCLSARTTPTVSWRGNTGPRPAKFLGALENTAPQISCTLSLARFRERQALDTHVLSSVVRTRSLQPCFKLRPRRGAGTRSSRPTVGAVAARGDGCPSAAKT
jgi:hypothetical protein